MRKTNMCDAWPRIGWRVGARERGKFGERAKRTGERFVNNRGNRGGELRRAINDLLKKSINCTYIFVTDAICYAQILAA